jgi:hypothetical protein
MKKLLLFLIIILCANSLFSQEVFSFNHENEEPKPLTFRNNSRNEISFFNNPTFSRIRESIEDYKDDWEIDYIGGRRNFNLFVNLGIITRNGQPDGFGYDFAGINYDVSPFFSIGVSIGMSLFADYPELSWGGLSLSAGPIFPIVYYPDEFKVVLFGDAVLQIGYCELGIFNIGFALGVVVTFVDLVGIELKYKGLFHPEGNFMNHIGIALVWDLSMIFDYW